MVVAIDYDPEPTITERGLIHMFDENHRYQMHDHPFVKDANRWVAFNENGISYHYDSLEEWLDVIDVSDEDKLLLKLRWG